MSELKAITAHIQTLNNIRAALENAGHTFWHCGAQDQEGKRPFYYVSINRIVSMSTCTTCIQLIENNRLKKKLETRLSTLTNKQ